MAQQNDSVIPAERIHRCIFLIRGKKVILDRDLAQLYGVDIRVIHQTVQQHIDRFPDGFLFELSSDEVDQLSAQCDRFGSLDDAPLRPAAFTEAGIARVSSLLTGTAEANIAIMRVFLQLHRLVEANAQLRETIRTLRQPCAPPFGPVFAAMNAMIAEQDPTRQSAAAAIRNLKRTTERITPYRQPGQFQTDTAMSEA